MEKKGGILGSSGGIPLWGKKKNFEGLGEKGNFGGILGGKGEFWGNFGGILREKGDFWGKKGIFGRKRGFLEENK